MQASTTRLWTSKPTQRIMESVMGVSPWLWQDRGQRPREQTLAEVWTTSPRPAKRVPRLPPVGPNGIYLFELEAQPGGPEGRSDTTAGSKPITIVERPRSVPALRSCLFLVVVTGTESWLPSQDSSCRTRYCQAEPVSRQTATRFSQFIPGTTAWEIGSGARTPSPNLRARRFTSTSSTRMMM